MAEPPTRRSPEAEQAYRYANAAAIVGVLSLVMFALAPACAGITLPFGFVGSVLALGLGHAARTQLMRIGMTDGMSLARTGLICGGIGVGVVALGLLIVLVVVFAGGQLPWVGQPNAS